MIHSVIVCSKSSILLMIYEGWYSSLAIIADCAFDRFCLTESSRRPSVNYYLANRIASVEHAENMPHRGM